MASLMGKATPLGQPGATAGYFQVIRPDINLYYIPGLPLHPAVLDAYDAGSFTLKFGTLVGAGSDGLYKVVSYTAVNAWEIASSDVVSGIFPSLNTILDPSVKGSMQIAIPFEQWFDAQTDNVSTKGTDGNTWTPAVGDLVSGGTTGAEAGKLSKAITGQNDTDIVGVVLQVQTGVSGAPGAAGKTVLTVRFKGKDLTPWVVT